MRHLVCRLPLPGQAPCPSLVTLLFRGCPIWTPAPALPLLGNLGLPQRGDPVP